MAKIWIMCWGAVRLDRAKRRTLIGLIQPNRWLIDPGHVALRIGGWVYGYFPATDEDLDCPSRMVKQEAASFVESVHGELSEEKQANADAAGEDLELVIHPFPVQLPDSAATQLEECCKRYKQRCDAGEPATRYRLRDHNCMHVTVDLLKEAGVLDLRWRRWPGRMTPDRFWKHVLRPKIGKQAAGESGRLAPEEKPIRRPLGR